MKKLFGYLLLIPLLAGMLVACEGEKTNARNLEGRWNIIEVNGESINTERPTFMEFNINEMKLHGNAGCNTFNSSIRLDKDDASKINFNQAVTTMMACPDMDTENKILKELESVHKVKKSNKNNEILLTNSAGKVIFVLAK